MDRLEFRISPHDRSDWQRVRDRLQGSQQPAVQIGPLALSVPAAVLAVAAAVLIAPDLDATARVNGVPIAGSRILVVEDESGSMRRFEDELNRQKDGLARSISFSATRADGFGVLSTGAETNLLHVVERELASRRAVAAVYVIADFLPVDVAIDCNDAAGLRQFQQLIRRSGVRLYLSTVNMMPSAGLLAIARESGGGLIGLGSPAGSRGALLGVCGTDQ